MALLARLRDVRRSYRIGDVETPVLAGVDLDIHRGDFVVMFGPSGSGKTTLLNMVAGIDRADHGHIEVRGHELGSLSDRSLTDYRRRLIGYVFQFYNLVPTLTALENVELAVQMTGRSDGHAARGALAAVGLADKGRRFPSQLSGGEQQRVAIARAVAKRPLMLAADEPTGNLDARTSHQVIALLRRLNREQGLTILLATHDPQLARAGTRVVEIEDGRLRERARP